MKIRSIFLLFTTTFVILFSSVGPAWAKKYRLGVPKGYSTPTYKQLFASLGEKGFVTGENLIIVPIDLSGFKTETGKMRIRREITEQCDLFFTTGDHLKIIFQVELKTPLLFIAISNPKSNVPPAMKANTTGFYWDSTATMFERSIQLLPPDQKRKLGMTFFKGSSIANKVFNYGESCKKIGIDLVVKSYKNKDDIERVMREFKEEGVKGLTLFPPAARNGELAELIKWQKQIKLPLFGQVRSHIEKGVLGGPAIDYKILAPKLTDYVIRLLQGRNPAHLPVNYLSRKFIINLATVSELGINIPQEVIDQAEIVGIATQKQPEKEERPPLVPGDFVIGMAKNITNPVFPNLMNALAHLGYVVGENLRLAPIDLSGIGDPQQSRQIAERMAETNVFFATGNALPKLFQLPDLYTPVCFMSTKETADIPPALKHNFTGVIRGSQASIIEMALKMVPDAKGMGLLARNKSTLHPTIEKSGKLAGNYGLKFESKLFSTPAKIGTAMKELQQNSDFVLLFPPSLKPDDLVEIVKWQNQLHLPVVAQLKSHVEAGLLGGLVVDLDVVSPKLAEYIHKIFQGRKADSLPIHFTTGEYVINLRAASIINAKIPDEITAIAEIIH